MGKKCRFPPLSASRVPLKIYVSWNSIKGRNSYLRTHLTNRCTEYMEIKHRCSQILFKLSGLTWRCWVWFLGEELVGATVAAALGVPCLCISAYCKTNAEHYFCFLPLFSINAKILFGFLSVSQNRHHYRSFIKVKWCKGNFQKTGIPVPALERRLR